MPEPPRRRRGLAVLLLLVLALVAAGGVGVWLVLGDDEGADAPDDWDPRVADLVGFVEDARDLDFEHPVEVRFLTEEEFRAEVTTEDEDLTEEERREIEAFEGVFRSLGLIEGDVDLLAEINELQGGGVLAYYDHELDEMVVRGTDLTVGIRVTLVHELVHALQDQHFDLGRLDEEEATDGEDAAFRALVEGDAQRIEYEYVGELSGDEFAEYQQEYESEVEDAGLEAIPPVLTAFFSAPYVLGEGLVAVLDGEDGNEAVDEAFGDPPSSEEHLLDPWTYLDGDEPRAVDPPPLADAQEEIYSADFGALGWFLVLAERIDPREALVAVDGWGGDAFVVYEQGDRTCVQIVFEGDTEHDVDEMAAALDRWSAGLPEGVGDHRRDGSGVHLTSCDPGADADIDVRGVSEDALLVPFVRTMITLELSSVGVPADDARCVGSGVIAELDEEQLLSLTDLLAAEEPPEELVGLVDRAAATCGLV